ncbi:MAG: response regulator [Pseudomonadota bacterium]
MALILVKAESTDDYRIISQTLGNAGHETAALGQAGPNPGDAASLAREVAAAKADLVVMDYLAEDAFSVKVMQGVRTENPFIGFIFLMPANAEREHMILALNEGASALLSRPLRPAALVNYVNRSLVSRKEAITRLEEVERCQTLIEREKSCVMGQAETLSDQKRLLRNLCRLVDGLLYGLPDNNRKVLVVSDSAYQVDLFRRHLEERRFQVLTAADGEKGLEAAKAEKPRIIVSDLEMPGLGGLEFCRAVKNLDYLAPNYFVICTANENKVKAVMSPENKVDDCLVKPGRVEDFQEFVARVALGLLT